MRWIERVTTLLIAGLLGGLPAAAQQSAPFSSTGQSGFVVVLDAAHGGSDTGGHLASGQWEKNVTLALSVRLRSLLAVRGIQVVTTRESDTTVDQFQRTAIANHAHAQACLSLHASASGSGVHLFTSSLALAQPQRLPAWKTAQSPWVTRSLVLAGELNSALQHAGMNVTLGRTALPALDSMTCPAVAVEIAPERISGQSFRSRLDNPVYQAHVASALAAALLEWRAEARQP
jgi:N-acetylmuramoyl-L-alanine amidase